MSQAFSIAYLGLAQCGFDIIVWPSAIMCLHAQKPLTKITLPDVAVADADIDTDVLEFLPQPSQE